METEIAETEAMEEPDKLHFLTTVEEPLLLHQMAVGDTSMMDVFLEQLS